MDHARSVTEVRLLRHCAWPSQLSSIQANPTNDMYESYADRLDEKNLDIDHRLPLTPESLFFVSISRLLEFH